MGVDKPSTPEVTESNDFHSEADMARFEITDKLQAEIGDEVTQKFLTDLLLKYGVANTPKVSEEDASLYPTILDTIKGTSLADKTETDGFPQGTEEMFAITPDEYPEKLQKFIKKLIENDPIIEREIERYEDWCKECNRSKADRSLIDFGYEEPESSLSKDKTIIHPPVENRTITHPPIEATPPYPFIEN